VGFQGSFLPGRVYPDRANHSEARW
jgi:hypothetical protein